jgi:ABC-type multidrug transport system fused ATPase/permease subunit
MLEAIDEYARSRPGGVTRIIIAHRLSAIEHVDAILFLQDGLVVENGTFQVCS